MEKAIPEYPAREFSIPPGVVNVRIDLETGKLSRKNDYTSRFEYFIKGTEPTEYVRGDSNNDDIFEDEGGLF